MMKCSECNAEIDLVDYEENCGMCNRCHSEMGRYKMECPKCKNEMIDGDCENETCLNNPKNEKKYIEEVYGENRDMYGIKI